MKKILYLFLIVAGSALVSELFFFAPIARAADITASPAVIDAHGLPRDMFNYGVTVTNTGGRPENIFAAVHELTADGKQAFTDPSISDRPASLANWIEISRGAILLQPGGSTTLPVGITINPFATSGEYHAVISFVEGGTRADAEQHLDGAPQVLVNMAVASNDKEVLVLEGFGASKAFYPSFPVDINFTLENKGNVPSIPLGVVLFYDRIGHELGSVDANPDNVPVAPGEKKPFTVTWKDGPNFGQYKAVVQLAYGAQAATLADTALFWILPWQKLLIIFGTLLVIFIFLAIWLHKKYEKQHYARARAMERFMKQGKLLDLRHPKDRHD